MGQEDLSVAEARAIAGASCFVGKSTHSVAQARAALAEGADYIGFGPLFATGTKPKPDASAYPPFDEVLRTYRALRAKNLKLLDEVGENGLDRLPKDIPPGFEDAMKTFGHTFLLITLHNMVHYGQIADARRAAGRKPLM